jgi:hypothetical protein
VSLTLNNKKNHSVLRTRQNGFGVRVTSYLLRVVFSPYRAKRSGGEFDHTFPFSDAVNAWRCATIPLYMSIV